jgi:hypothetical protein
MRTFGLLILLAVTLSPSACASGPGPRSSGGQNDLLTSAELRDIETGSLSLEQAIQRLRPLWLRARSTTIMGGTITPLVYVNGTRFGGGNIVVLRTIPVHEVEEVRFLSASDATTQYGTGHAGGVIAVRSRR